MRMIEQLRRKNKRHKSQIVETTINKSTAVFTISIFAEDFKLIPSPFLQFLVPPIN